MPKHESFITHTLCKREHRIFAGKNALRHAVYFSKTGREVSKECQLYKIEDTTSFDKSMCWGFEEAATAMGSKESILGDGVHAKVYKMKNGDIILSSQNNGSSPLFEFAILYKSDTRLKALDRFVDGLFTMAKKHQAWYKKSFKKDVRGLNVR